MRILIFSLFLSLVLSSCIDLVELNDARVTNYQAEFALPLINSHVTVKDILDSDTPIEGLSVDPDGTLRLQYEGVEIRREGVEVFDQITRGFPSTFPVFRSEIRYPLSLVRGIELNRLDFKSGQFTYYFENPHPDPLSVVFEFRSLIKDGEFFKVEAEVPAYSGTGARPTVTNRDSPVDLRDYRLIPEDNRVVLIYSATNRSGEELELADFEVQVLEPTFSYAEGYAGQFIIEGAEDSVGVELLEQSIETGIQLTDPTVTLKVENSFGWPTQLRVNELFLQNIDGSIEEVSSTLIDEGLIFSYPQLTEIGGIANDVFIFNRNNSNVVNLFASSPTSMVYDIDALVNPLRDQSLIGFITDSSYLSLKLGVDLPLVGTLEDYVTRDTFAFDLGEVDMVKQAIFKVIAENELGVDIKVQAYFLDEQDVILDTLFVDRQLIAKATNVDGTGLGTEPAVTTTFIETDEVRSERIRQASQIVLELSFSTETNNPRPVRIQEQQGIRLKIGAVVTIEN
jgi:hypothetical protein